MRSLLKPSAKHLHFVGELGVSFRMDERRGFHQAQKISSSTPTRKMKHNVKMMTCILLYV